MYRLCVFFAIFQLGFTETNVNNVLGCGGFIQSHVQIDFARVEIKLLTKQGILKDTTTCAPNNGYYFIPIYDKGDYVLELNPPAGWSFSPSKIDLTIDGSNDLCSKGTDINFVFKGFGIAGKVENLGDPSSGPQGVLVELLSKNEVRKTETIAGGIFSFSPVYPGLYKIKLSHPSWKFVKDEIQVTVTEGNTELPVNSLVMQGYTVTGLAKSEGEAVLNITILLFSENPQIKTDYIGCDKKPVAGLSFPKKPICQVKTDAAGSFKITNVPVGQFEIIPFHLNQNIHIEPKAINLVVTNDDVQLAHHFEVVGFSVKGRIVRLLDSSKKEGLKNVDIYVNGKAVTKTDNNGYYKLQALKTGLLKIRGEAEDVLIEEVTLKVNPNLESLPDIAPYAFKICGIVDSDKSELITIMKVDSTLTKNVQSDSKTGKFCEYLPKGTYELQVQNKHNGKDERVQFYPLSQKIEVFRENSNVILFSQLKATINGKVQCLQNQDCENSEVTLKSIDGSTSEELVTKISGAAYQFEDVFPGIYQLSLQPNKLCWEKTTQEISINSINENVPDFIQKGYSINFISSHTTKVAYKLLNTKISETIEIQRGPSTICLPKNGLYQFEFLSCHAYPNKFFTINTQVELKEIKLDAVAHANKICISSDADHGSITTSIDIEGEKIQQGPLPYKNGCYLLEIMLEPESNAIILPQSEIYHFQPPIITIKGKSDCTDWGTVLKAIKGQLFKGRVNPPLAGTMIILEDDSGEIMTTETDDTGFYKFPPMSDAKKYKISAKKESYQLVGPSDAGDFNAFKLAQINVEVVEENKKTPLQGTLLSLSGAVNYRSNLQTDENGRLTFHSLQPSEYFLKPMLKEYTFEPASKIIHVTEGENINVTLIGKRVAYSAFGKVASLSNIPEQSLIVAARGIDNCSYLSEETTTDSNGMFRIRGLHPFCTYRVEVRDPDVEQTIPESVVIKDIGNDIKDLQLISIRPIKETEVLVRIYSEAPELTKMLKLNVYLKGPQLSLVHSLKLDSNIKISKDNNPGMMVHLPPLPRDKKSYTLQLETSSLQNLKWIAESATIIANSSFKFVQLEYAAKMNVTEPQLKQTSVWTFLFIVFSLLVAYNIKSVIQLVNDKFNFNSSYLQSLKPKNKKSTHTNHSANSNDDIDQIMRNINSVKRKPKRAT